MVPKNIKQSNLNELYICVPEDNSTQSNTVRETATLDPNLQTDSTQTKQTWSNKSSKSNIH